MPEQGAFLSIDLRVALVGATGLVGQMILRVLEERHFPICELIPVASARSIGKTVRFHGKEVPIVSMEEAISRKAHVALFSAGGDVSKEWAPMFAQNGTTVVDNSSAWRMDLNIPLVVPEVNGDAIGPEDRIIANPNCSTIQLVMALKPLHDAFTIKRGIVSTYQSITGTGQAAIEQMKSERAGSKELNVYPHPIDQNCIPHCDVFGDNGYTREEMKVWNETQKILGDETVAISCTAVRVPVMGGHSESVYLEFESDFEIDHVMELLASFPGVEVVDNPSANVYPMPLLAEGRDEVLVGRIRRDLAYAKGLHLWVVADNLRKGAATNTVQIASFLNEKGRWSKHA